MPDPASPTPSQDQGADARPVPDRPTGGTRRGAYFRDSGRLRARPVQDAGREPDQAGGHDPRGQRGVRRRRLRAGSRAGVRVRHLLRRRPVGLQQHRRRLRREVAGGRPERLAGTGRARASPAAASQGEGLRHAVQGLPAVHRRLGGARRPADRLHRDRPGARRVRPEQAAGLPGDSPRPGRHPPSEVRNDDPSPSPRATPTRSARRSTRRRARSRRPSGR